MMDVFLCVRRLTCARLLIGLMNEYDRNICARVFVCVGVCLCVSVCVGVCRCVLVQQRSGMILLKTSKQKSRKGHSDILPHTHRNTFLYLYSCGDPHRQNTFP